MGHEHLAAGPLKEIARDGQSRALGSGIETTDQCTDQSQNASVKLQLPHIVSTWSKGKNTIKVIIDSFAGKIRLDIREWYFGGDGNERPGKGLSVTLDQLDRFATALDLARDLIVKHGIAGQADRR
jgi:Transcriptional Coactivator p15 (PC4)